MAIRKNKNELKWQIKNYKMRQTVIRKQRNYLTLQQKDIMGNSSSKKLKIFKKGIRKKIRANDNSDKIKIR